MKQFWIGVLLVVFSSSAIAQSKTWGPATAAKPGFDRKARLDELFDKLSKSPNETASRIIFDDLFSTWMTAPDEEAAETMNQALRARGGFNFDKAIKILNPLIERLPEYAQAWNERSYVYFLKNDYGRSLEDCERVIEIEPRHIGCLSGMARILIRHQKRYKAGKAVLEEAMKWHPRIYEKVLLKEIPASEL